MGIFWFIIRIYLHFFYFHQFRVMFSTVHLGKPPVFVVCIFLVGQNRQLVCFLQNLLR